MKENNYKDKYTRDYYRISPSYLKGARIRRRLKLVNELLFIHKKNKEQQFKIVDKLLNEKKVLEDLIKANKEKWNKVRRERHRGITIWYHIIHGGKSNLPSLYAHDFLEKGTFN